MRPILWYYWLTPLFLLVDVLGGPDIRTAALDGHPWWKGLYYFFCMTIPIIAHYHPGWTPRLGLVESSTNILLLVLGIFVPYYDYVYRVAEGAFPAEPPITMEKMANFILAAGVAVVSYQIQNERQKLRRFRSN